MCQHPVSALKEITVSQGERTTTMHCSCGNCGVKITKEATTAPASEPPIWRIARPSYS